MSRLRSGRRQRPEKCRTLINLALRPNTTAMPFDDAPHGRESDPGPRKIGHRMKPLERRKQLVRIAHVEPGAVVANEIDDPVRFLLNT